MAKGPLIRGAALTALIAYAGLAPVASVAADGAGTRGLLFAFVQNVYDGPKVVRVPPGRKRTLVSMHSRISCAA